jgi:hypothetical protein
VHHAQLHDGLRPGDGDRVGQAGQPVAAHDAHIGHAAALQLAEDGEPELGGLAGGRADPQAQDLLSAVAVDADRHIDRPVGHHPVADLHHQRIDEDHRVDAVQRPGLPLRELVHHRVSDPGDQVRGHLHAVDLAQVRADVAGGHPARIQRDDPLIEALQPGLALAHDLRLEGPVAVPGHRQVDGADIGQHGLAGGAVAVVAAAPPGRVVLVIAQVAGHLLSQSPLQHRLSDLGQQAVRAEQLDALGRRLAQQLIGQLLIDQRPALRALAIGFAGHHRSVLHHVSFREPPFLRPIVRPRHLHSR